MTNGPEPDLVAGFRAAFRAHPAGVAIVTTAGPATPAGLTATSVASVSADPPMLSFVVSRLTGSGATVLAGDAVDIHLLTPAAATVADSFAHTGAPRFTSGQGWAEVSPGRWRLADAHARLGCRVVDRVRAGSAVLVVAEVVDAETSWVDPRGGLLYVQRAFHQVGESLAILPAAGPA